MNRILASMIGAALAFSVHAQQATDHYEALSLERAAFAKLAAGDRDSACILIDRASRISPYDKRIAANIDELEQKALVAPPPVRATPQAPVPAAIPPEPPALWPRR
jgi:hypothetical protein